MRPVLSGDEPEARQGIGRSRAKFASHRTLGRVPARVAYGSGTQTRGDGVVAWLQHHSDLTMHIMDD